MQHNNKRLYEITVEEFTRDFDSHTAAARALGVARSTFFDMAQRNDTLLLEANPDGSWKYLGKIDYNGSNQGNHIVRPAQTVREQTKETARETVRVEVGNDEQAQFLAETLEAEKRKVEDLTIKCNALSADLNRAKKERLVTEEVREYILGLTSQPIGPAEWLSANYSDTSAEIADIVGVPTLMLSDIHHGESVFPSQVFGKNEYNMEISKARLRETAWRVVNVLTYHMVAPNGYPGIVVDLAGDLVSGDIHDELVATNEMPTMPVVLDLLNEKIAMLKYFADVFKRVMCFVVPGNHGRTTKKVQAKNYAYTNYDWLIGCLLERFFADDDRIQFFVSDQPDLQYKIYQHRFRLTHGAQFRGGTGFVGAWAPISRGDKKKRISAMSYDMEYDTLLMAHFHQLWMTSQIIVNGSMIGFNEFAIANNFEYDDPKQALFITHPYYGITYNMPIFCQMPTQKGSEEDRSNWVAWCTD